MFGSVLASLLDGNPTQKNMGKKISVLLYGRIMKSNLDISCLSQVALMRCETEDTRHTVSVPAFRRRHGTISRHTVTGIDVMDQDKLTSPELQQGRISCRTARVRPHL